MTEKPLSMKEKRTCELYALEGYSKSNAWRIGMEKKPPAKTLKEQPYYFKNRAWDFFNQSHIIAYVNGILETARAEDCMRVGRAVRQLEDFIQEAGDSENWTAVSQLMDKKLKVMGLMRDTNRFVLTAEGSMDDETLIEALADGDEEKKALLKKIVIKDSFN